MKRKNLTARKKANKSNLLLKNKKISDIYLKFKSILFKNIKNNDFALAVSGGADSLCLAYFSKLYSMERVNKIHVLIVDHNLRKESSAEALKVRKILKKKILKAKFLLGKEIPQRATFKKKLGI